MLNQRRFFANIWRHVNHITVRFKGPPIGSPIDEI